MLVRQFIVEGLGHISALVADEARGVAAVIDPRRDVDVYLDEAGARGWRISHVLETHLHNDYVSGARELAALTGAAHVIGAAAEAHYEHLAALDGDAFDVGALRFSVLDTPGHTPEHVCYALADRTRADEPLTLFSGGSLLVGAVGRTDLLGEANAEPYARQMFHSLHDRLLAQPDYVGVLPTHGGGSLCSKDISATPSSTIGFERRHNPLAAVDDIDAFVQALLTDQPAYPHYFARMRPINQAGPSPLGAIPAPIVLPLPEVRALLDRGALVVDARPFPDYAAGHLPGAFSIPAGSSFGTWLGWVVAHDRPLVLVVESVADWDDLYRQARRIGYDDVRGMLSSVADWAAAGQPLETSRSATVDELRGLLVGSPDDPIVLDVRQRDEYERSHVPGALNLFAGNLNERLAELPRDRPIVTICTVGYRSAVAASLLDRAGFSDVTWIRGGVPEWRRAGYDVERGPAPG